MQLGLFLKQYRKEARLSGKQLATQLGISKHALEKYENAGVMPGYAAALKMLQFFQLTDLDDISQEDLDRNICYATNLEKDSSGSNHDIHIDGIEVNYELLLAEKEKRILHLEEMIQLLREQIHILRKR